MYCITNSTFSRGFLLQILPGLARIHTTDASLLLRESIIGDSHAARMNNVPYVNQVSSLSINHRPKSTRTDRI